MVQLTDDLARLLAGRQPDLMDKRGPSDCMAS